MARLQTAPTGGARFTRFFVASRSIAIKVRWSFSPCSGCDSKPLGASRPFLRIAVASQRLNQDFQDEQDAQDDSPSPRGIRPPPKTACARSDRTLICSGCDACEGQALALRAPRRVFFRSAGAVTPIPTLARVYPAGRVLACRFSCIAYLAPAITPPS